MNDMPYTCLAVESLLMEVSSSPKPGLVDRYNNGAHTDMDYFLFQKSVTALIPAFMRMEEAGRNHTGSPRELLARLRGPGIAGEKRMYRATNNVNTHKGALFVMGILTALSSWLAQRGMKVSGVSLCDMAGSMCEGIVERELGELCARRTGRLSTGERMYIRYGATGIRGELEKGLISVREAGLPAYEWALANGLGPNDSLVHALLGLMTRVEDTTILNRHDRETLEYVKRMANEALGRGGMMTDEGRAFVEEMDRLFIERNISPGGSADLLAATYFIHECGNTP